MWLASIGREWTSSAAAGERNAFDGAQIAPGIVSLSSVGAPTRFAIFSAYGVAFTLLRLTSAHWATHQLFSVWFPAAGLRFAFLWIVGPRRTVPAAAAELLVSVGAGTVTLGPNVLISLVGVVGPCLVYGTVIGAVRARMRRHRGTELDPLGFAIAAVLGPMAACVAGLAWALPLSVQHGSIDPPLLFSALLVFTLGDLLGILILAPPLIWLSERVRSGAWPLRLSVRSLARYVELGALLACGWALVWLLQHLGDGLVLAPVLLAACWCGLRGGRIVAWAAILVIAAIVLPLTKVSASDAVRVQVHMQLACVAVGAYLAGSYADAQARAVVEIDRRDRLLLQAERLKTLRAMSVAVIHEVSQPLSTIAIEARAMVEASRSTDPDLADIREIAALIARKSDDLSELIRRLRTFGGGGNEGRATQNLPQLVADVIALAAPEAKDVGVHIESLGGPDVAATVNDVEIRQALLNLVRNAIAAVPTPNGVVRIGWSEADGLVRVSIDNPIANRRRAPGGMGMGLMIARTIAQAHGGGVSVAATSSGVRSTLDLPVEGIDR